MGGWLIRDQIAGENQSLNGEEPLANSGVIAMCVNPYTENITIYILCGG